MFSAPQPAPARRICGSPDDDTDHVVRPYPLSDGLPLPKVNGKLGFGAVRLAPRP